MLVQPFSSPPLAVAWTCFDNESLRNTVKNQQLDWVYAQLQTYFKLCHHHGHVRPKASLKVNQHLTVSKNNEKIIARNADLMCDLHSTKFTQMSPNRKIHRSFKGDILVSRINIQPCPVNILHLCHPSKILYTKISTASISTFCFGLSLHAPVVWIALWKLHYTFLPWHKKHLTSGKV